MSITLFYYYLLFTVASNIEQIQIIHCQALVKFRDCGIYYLYCRYTNFQLIQTWTHPNFFWFHFHKGSGEVEKVTIEPCPELPCHFNQGERANLSITFVLKQSANSVHFKSSLRRGGGLWDYEMEVPESDRNVCRGDGDALTNWGKLDCPLEKNKQYTFVISRVFPVSSSFNVS